MYLLYSIFLVCKFLCLFVCILFYFTEEGNDAKRKKRVDFYFIIKYCCYLMVIYNKARNKKEKKRTQMLYEIFICEMLKREELLFFAHTKIDMYCICEAIKFSFIT